MLNSYEDAETFVLEAIEGEKLPYVFAGPAGYILEEVAKAFISLPTSSTLNELAVAYEDNGWMTTPESIFHHPLDEREIETLALVLKKYQNVAEKVSRQDNWLNPDSKVDDSRDWQSGYRNAVAEFLINNGVEANKSLNFYGWRSYEDKRTAVPVAVFHVLEHYVSEFTDTFNDPDEEAGITGEVLLSDGTTIYMRWEGTMTEVIRNITSV